MFILIILIYSTIALILLHTSRNSDAYQHIHIPGLKKTGTTLIITPATIIRQWQSEFKRHAPGLRVAIYSGIKYIPHFMESEDMVDILSSNDVVLTSYNVSTKIKYNLSKEMNTHMLLLLFFLGFEIRNLLCS